MGLLHLKVLPESQGVLMGLLHLKVLPEPVEAETNNSMPSA
jgi:hypothetical protein